MHFITMPRFIPLGFTLLLAFCLMRSSQAQEHGFSPIDAPGATATLAIGISPKGDIVGYYLDSSPPNSHGFLLSKGKFAPIDFPGAVSTFATGINLTGDIVGHYLDIGGRFHGFRLSKGEFTPIDVPGSTFTFANGINPRGDIVGQYQDGYPPF